MSMKNSDFGPRDYSDGRTKQSFKEQCDINKILNKHKIKNAANHAMQFPPEFYGQFEGHDLLEAHELINNANRVFSALDSETRKEFGNDALKFAAFASDRANVGRLSELLPRIAEPGSYFPNPVNRGGDGAGAATPAADAPAAVAEPPPAEAPAAPDPEPGQ